MAHDDTAAHLSGGLPEYYPSSPSSANYDLLKPVADELDTQESDIEEVADGATVQNATTIEQLSEHGKLVDAHPRDGESLEHYRARLEAEFSTVTGKGLITNLIETTASILNTSESNIRFSEPAGDERGTAELGLPKDALDELDLQLSDLINILDRLIAAGYRLEAFQIGTFTYITPSDYNNNLHDATIGYDGLDANGNPKDNGGTYAGLIN